MNISTNTWKLFSGQFLLFLHYNCRYSSKTSVARHCTGRTAMSKACEPEWTIRNSLQWTTTQGVSTEKNWRKQNWIRTFWIFSSLSQSVNALFCVHHSQADWFTPELISYFVWQVSTVIWTLVWTEWVNFGLPEYKALIGFTCNWSQEHFGDSVITDLFLVRADFGQCCPQTSSWCNSKPPRHFLPNFRQNSLNLVEVLYIKSVKCRLHIYVTQMKHNLKIV